VTHFGTYNVHIYKQITTPWSDQQEDDSVELIEDRVLCGLLEAITVLYLKQRGPLARDLIVGAQHPDAPTRFSYSRPFMTAELSLDVLPVLERILADLVAKVSDAAVPLMAS